MKTFWNTLKRPFFVAAPMEDITDAAFRRLLSECGKPDVLWTEFTAADGLLLADERGKKKLMKKLEYAEVERPIVAQLFTSKPEHMEKVARMCKEMGFDGSDINMGCPDRAIEKQGCGSALIKTPDLAVELIRAAKRGAGDMPVSVKTRIGYNHDQLEEWIPTLLKEDVAALTIHARTRKEMSKVPAHWDRIKRAVEIRDEVAPHTPIIGNGDVTSLKEAQVRVEETGCDGVMIGRGVIGNPWVFRENAPENPSREERLAVLRRHIELYIEIFGDEGHFPPMKKHMSKYATGFDGAKELRMKLMEVKTPEEALQVLGDL